MATVETNAGERRDEARRWLGRFAFLVRLNERALDLVASAEQSMAGVAQRYGESVTTSAKEAMSGQMARLGEACELLRDCSAMYGEALDEISEAVERVGDSDPLAGEVLARRYLAWGRPPDFEEIADDMGYSCEWVRKLHQRGLDAAWEAMPR